MVFGCKFVPEQNPPYTGLGALFQGAPIAGSPCTDPLRRGSGRYASRPLRGAHRT